MRDTLHLAQGSPTGVVGSIPGFSSPSDETLKRGPMIIFLDISTYCDPAADYVVPNVFVCLFICIEV